MLLRFSASNFGSLRDRQDLSLIASKLKGESKGLIEAPELRNETILPAAVIYGPNASGKTNLLKAFAYMRGFIINSHRGGAPGEPIEVRPFALDPEFEDRPSSFASDFIFGGALYTYSFSATRAGIVSEVLHTNRAGRSSLLFERNYQHFSFGRGLKGQNRTIEQLTRNNSLFVSAAAQNNHDELGKIVEFFRSTTIQMGDRETINPDFFLDSSLNEQIIRLLHRMDVDITDFMIKESPLKDEEIEFREMIRQFIKKSASQETPKSLRDRLLENKKILEIGHKGANDKTIYFGLQDESAGTIQILLILSPIFRALREGHVMIIDEFGRRVHTRAAEIMLSLFNKRETNPNGAQLIVATHDTNLLNTRGLRRDQVWFTEKDRSGGTHLYPLTDFETRKDDNLEKGYLQGRFGAIPFAGSFENLLEAD
jgi:AAA15 family ATPase/GTPase